MYKCKTWILILLIVAVSTLVASPLGDEFASRIRQTITEDAALQVIQDFKDQLTELSDLRTMQNYWMDIDPQACQAYFHARYLTNPTDAEARYLWVRTITDNVDQIVQARGLINAHPTFYWGYRSLSGAYLNTYYEGRMDSLEVAAVVPNLDSDMALLRQGLQRYPADEYLLITLMSYHLNRQEYPLAESYALLIRDPSALQANFEKVDRLVKESGRLTAFEQLFPRLLSNMIEAGQIPATDSLTMYNYYLLDTLKALGNWDRIDLLLMGNPAIQSDSRFVDILIQINISRGRFPEAIELLSAAIEANSLKLADLEESEKWGALVEQEAWQTLLTQARLQREAALPQIRQAALENRINTPAPLFQFPGINGEIVRLEDYRGQIVILDFWATWCNPCMLSMPVIDEWMRTRMPQGVKVFSINVWERNPEAAREMMRNHNFQMTYLAGDREVSSRFGFDGIPYICVIDQEGNFAWDHSGYSDDLSDILSFWVEELQGNQE